MLELPTIEQLEARIANRRREFEEADTLGASEE